jgi:hypothetical protein
MIVNDEMPNVATPNLTGVPRIVVPGGIGDVYWVMVKIEAFCKKYKITEKPRIVVLSDNSVWESSQTRAIPFVERIPFVTMNDPSTTPLDPVDPRPECLQKIYEQISTNNGYTVFPGFMGYEYFLIYNGMINSGHYLEEDELECNWYIPLVRSEDQEQFQNECIEKYGKYAVFYFSIIGDFVARNVAQFSIDKMAASIADFTKKSGLTPVFIGAWWDLRWPVPNSPSYLSELMSKVPGAVNIVGQTSLDQAFGVMNGAELVAGYHCGLTNIAVMFKKKTVLLWATDRFPANTPLAVAPPETRMTTYIPLLTGGLTVDKFSGTMMDLYKIDLKPCSLVDVVLQGK